MMKLQKILEQHESPLMRVSIKTIRNRAILESRIPQSGAYWWIPTPDGDWTMDVYYDSEHRGNTMHDRIWRRHVIEKLAVLWGKDPDWLKRAIGDNYTGLPRGRVNKVQDGFTIVHGNDAPVKDVVTKIMNAFNLRTYFRAHPDKVRAFEDEHETMLQGDPDVVQKALGTDLGLKGSFHADFDDDYGPDDDYDPDDF